MMEFTGARGNDKVLLKIGKLDTLTKQGIRHGFFRFARDLQQDVNREILRKPKSGRVYRIKTRTGRRRHVASAPGETHANLSGTLRKSLGWKVRGADSMEFGYGVANTPAPDYASEVENGTRKMKARPSLKLGVKRNLRNAQKHFEDGILRKVAG